MPRKKKEDEVSVEETVSTVETSVDETVAVASDAVEAKPKKSTTAKASPVVTEPNDSAVATDAPQKKRATRIGVVTSDKMTKTVVVRVDRLIKHPRYRKYVRRKKQFMAHDELGSSTGDKVMIVETRPLSARKRWRVVEIIQKAEK
jgi:small subunit ribosomal protein S17